jgi:lipopolysaccharide transport system ATP-binding protein
MQPDDVAILVHDLKKCYRIGLKDEFHDNFLSAALSFLKSPVRNYRKYRSLYRFEDTSFKGEYSRMIDNEDIIWALNGVSFEVKRGEVLGIIGRNGAGKSTLLKILSKITAPSSGRAEIRGRVSSLLEVGTGFHQELTGRENVYLNGAVLGMTKKEVDRKFDEIIDFSGVERFIDTPVKRYSSGMKVRLAFSVAAHLEPEILLIDEVLAVGDERFQRKCLGKMDQVAKQGRTVLFVSHNMGAVARLCDRVILLKDGQITLNGLPGDVISSYLDTGEAHGSAWTLTPTLNSDMDVQVTSARVLSWDNNPSSFINYDKQFKVEISYEVKKAVTDLIILCRLTDMQGNILWTSWDTDSTEWKGRVRQAGKYVSVCKFPGCWLRPSRYLLSFGAFVRAVQEFCHHENALALNITDVGFNLNIRRNGVMTPILDWEVKQIDGSF